MLLPWVSHFIFLLSCLQHSLHGGGVGDGGGRDGAGGGGGDELLLRIISLAVARLARLDWTKLVILVIAGLPSPHINQTDYCET